MEAEKQTVIVMVPNVRKNVCRFLSQQFNLENFEYPLSANLSVPEQG